MAAFLNLHISESTSTTFQQENPLPTNTVCCHCTCVDSTQMRHILWEGGKHLPSEKEEPSSQYLINNNDPLFLCAQFTYLPRKANGNYRQRKMKLSPSLCHVIVTYKVSNKAYHHQHIMILQYCNWPTTTIRLERSPTCNLILLPTSTQK